MNSPFTPRIFLMHSRDWKTKKRRGKKHCGRRRCFGGHYLCLGLPTKFAGKGQNINIKHEILTGASAPNTSLKMAGRDDMETQEAELLLSTALHGLFAPNTSLDIEGSKEREDAVDRTQSSKDEEIPDPPVDSAEDGERSESEMSKDVGPQGSSKLASGGGEDGGGEAGGGEAGGGEGGAGPSGRHAGVRQPVRQAATAIMMDKALTCFAKGIMVREDAKKFLKDRAKTFLEQLLCRDELAGSMDPKMVGSAIAGWIPEQADIGERMRSVPPSPPTVI